MKFTCKAQSYLPSKLHTNNRYALLRLYKSVISLHEWMFEPHILILTYPYTIITLLTHRPALLKQAEIICKLNSMSHTRSMRPIRPHKPNIYRMCTISRCFHCINSCFTNLPLSVPLLNMHTIYLRIYITLLNLFNFHNMRNTTDMVLRVAAGALAHGYIYMYIRSAIQWSHNNFKLIQRNIIFV